LAVRPQTLEQPGQVGQAAFIRDALQVELGACQESLAVPTSRHRHARSRCPRELEAVERRAFDRHPQRVPPEQTSGFVDIASGHEQECRNAEILQDGVRPLAEGEVTVVEGHPGPRATRICRAGFLAQLVGRDQAAPCSEPAHLRREMLEGQAGKTVSRDTVRW
jgi:hypothetical protein